MADEGGIDTQPGVGLDPAGRAGAEQRYGPTARGGAGSLALDSPRGEVYRVRVTGPLDALTGNRVLRLVDARLRVIAHGGSRTRSIMVDLTDADPASHGGLGALGHAHDACRAAGITFCVLGAGRLAARLPAGARHDLGQIPAYPSLDSALAVTGFSTRDR